jgi:hypothetical protein
MISHISFQQVEILIQDDPGGLNMDWMDPLVTFQHPGIQSPMTAMADNVQSVFNDFNPAHVSLSPIEQIDPPTMVQHWGQD